MTPDEIKEARQRLGLSQRELADSLGLKSDGGRTVRRWEGGEVEITGPAQLAIRYRLLQKTLREALDE